MAKAATASPHSAVNVMAQLVPCSGNSSRSPLAEVSQSLTAGSGSMSTTMRVQRVFPDRDAGRQQNRDRFSHIADFCVRNDALLERLEFRQRLQSHCDAGRA